MTPSGYFVLALLAVPASILGVAIARFNLKRRRIRRLVAAAKPEALESVYALIEATSATQPVASVLCRTSSLAADDTTQFTIPLWLPLPWAGRAVQVLFEPSIHVVVTAQGDGRLQFRGRSYRALKVPRVLTPSGTPKNVYSPERYLRTSEALPRALLTVSSRYPQEALSYLLSPGGDTFEFDGLNQVRFGGSPAWVQAPQFPKCLVCNHSMQFILQMPGTLAPPVSPEAIVYLFGCLAHPDQLNSITQFS